MSTLFSLLVLPNFKPEFVSSVRDLTPTLNADSLPSISISSERGDVPLTASVSDLSLTLANAAGEWDSALDVAKIMGVLPPVEAESLRAPVVHYGRVLLCRRMIHLSTWQVLFLGYIDPISPQFDRDARTCAITAYAPGKLLESGDAERVNRFSERDPAKGARPFLVYGNLTHPVPPPFSASSETDDRWWLARNIAHFGVYPGDQFKVVHDIVWAPGVQTVPYDDNVLTITAVAPSGDDVYFQTKESSPLILGPSSLSSAIMEYQNPWYRSRKWEDLVTDLIAEVNAALAQVGVPDTLSVDVANLPLLPVTAQIFSQPINMADALPPITGVAYQLNAGSRFLFYSRAKSPILGELFGKSDILAANDYNGGTAVDLPAFAPAGAPADFGPDFGLASRLLCPTPILGSAADDTETVANFDFAVCGQDLHAFNSTDRTDQNPSFDSVHWTRTPDSYTVSGEPKRFYRIYCRGRWVGAPTNAFKKGIQIRELTTADGGTTWTLASIGQNLTSYPDDSDAAPNQGRWPARPDMKVFHLGTTYLYCWTDPVKNSCHVKASATDTLAASALFPGPASFVTPDSIDAPIGSSGFVTEGLLTNTVWFFCDRADGRGVDLYYWNGTVMLAGTFADTSGKGWPSLSGGDFINAITDTSGSRHMLYVMQGKVLYAISYEWDFSSGTLTSTDWQAIQIDQTNYSPVEEAQTAADGGKWAATPSALAWLTGPVQQALPGEPDYNAASSSCVVATTNYIYIVSNAAVNIVDVADFEGLSCAAALSDLILVRGYQMLTEADQDLIADPATYDPIPFVRFRQRLIPFPSVVDLSHVTERADVGTWLENYPSVTVENSKLSVGPVGSDARLTTLEGVTFTINAPRNAQSSALAIDCPFISTVSFAKLLANLYAQEFAVPRPSGQIVVQDPYSIGLATVLKPSDWITYLVRPPDGINSVLYQAGRVLTIDYTLDTALATLKVA